MLVYVACFAALLCMVILTTVYLADRYEREPVALIQDCFLLGALGQLVLILGARLLTGPMPWSGWWLLVTVASAALYLPFHLRRLNEANERFDGIVYTVALLSGAICVIHLNNLPLAAGISPYRAVLAQEAAPGVRDLLVLASWPGFQAELGLAAVVTAAAVLMGAILGALRMADWPPLHSAATAAGLGLAVVGLDLASRGATSVRVIIAAAALLVAVAVKHRSVFKHRPEAGEPQVLVLALKTLLMVLGTALLATALLQTLTPGEQLPAEAADIQYQRPAPPDAIRP